MFIYCLQLFLVLKVNKMKLVALILLIIALAIPASASSVVSWTKEDIPGYNLTLNYTSEFNVMKDDSLRISIKNIGNKYENDTITVNKIQVIATSYAEGIWTGPSVTIKPNSSDTIEFDLNVMTDDEETLNIRIDYSVNSETANKTLNIEANYPGTPEAGVNSPDDHNRINAHIIDWSPHEVVGYIYVNDTITYSITTDESLTNVKWTEDGNAVKGDNIDSSDTHTYSRTWDDGDLGFHTIAFKGTDDADNEVEFRWYVNVYEINGLRGGNWFDVIDYSNVKIKMFKVKTAKYGSNSENTLNFVNRLHDSIAARQMTREALRNAFKSGELDVSEYVAALKQIQSNIKDDLKIAKRMNDVKKGIEEEDQDNNYQSDRVKQTKVKEEKKKELSVASNSNGKKNGNNNNGNNGKNRKDDKEDD